MLTPIEIQNRTFKSGIGYDKKDVDAFCKEVLTNYENLYKENVELQDKTAVLNEGIQYYKTIEKTLQKALVLAEKTAEETKEAANVKAAAIEKDAHTQANVIISDAKHELNRIHMQTMELVQQYEKYRIQFQKLAETQMELIKSNSFHIDIANLDSVISKGIENLNELSEEQEKEEQKALEEKKKKAAQEQEEEEDDTIVPEPDEDTRQKEDMDFEFFTLND